MIKVRIDIEDTSTWGVESERLWASASELGLVLENSPTYAYGYSYKDTVSARVVDGQAVVTGVIARGGHSTFRILLDEAFDEKRWERYWHPLSEAGCSYESNEAHTVFAVDVKPTADIRKVATLLENGEAEGFWQYEDGHIGHSLG